jgi:tryptophan synthase alpha chain
MTYASIPVSYGVSRFVERAASVGVSGIIAPDLPPDYDEGIYDAAEAAGISVVPVLAPSVTDYRIELARERRPSYVYAALRRGITGEETEIGEENIAFIRRLERIGAPVMAGFGIRRPEQVAALGPYVDAVVVGSLLVDAIHRSESPEEAKAAVSQAVRRLAGSDEVSVS